MSTENKKINLLQVVNGFAIGGGELKLLELVKELSQQRSDKYNVVVCSVGQGGPLQPEFEKLGIPVFIIEKKHKFDISQVFRLYKIIKSENIDIIQTTLFYADVIGALAAKLAGVDAVVSWDTVSHPPDSIENKLRHKLSYQFCMRFVKKIVAVSGAVKKFLMEERSIAPDKIDIIHYGIDLNLFNSPNGFIHIKKKEELGVSKGKKIIGTVARLEAQKGHKYLIDAAPQIIKEVPDVMFVFAGDGTYRSELEKQVQGLGLSEYFRFLGFREDVKELLYTFDIFVLPSLFEGLPNVILEAMASSRPVVATAVDGTPEVIENEKSGLLVTPKSSDALSKAIVSLLAREDYGESVGKMARVRIEEAFSFKMQFEKFEGTYESLLCSSEN